MAVRTEATGTGVTNVAEHNDGPPDRRGENRDPVPDVDGHADEAEPAFADTMLVTNPKSRRGASSIASFVERLREYGPVHVYDVDQSGSAGQAVREMATTKTRVIVGGGDGTLHYMLDAVLDSGATLGVLPLGTGNDFARSLELPLDVNGALDVIVAGRRRHVDVGSVNGIRFLNAVGIGLGPKLAGRLDASAKKRFGVLAYPLTAFDVFRTSRSFDGTLIVDGEEHSLRCMHITIASGVHYGGGMTISDAASIDDGRLDVLCVKRQSAWRLLRNVAAFRWGNLSGSEDLRVLSGRRVELRTEFALEVSADGELLTRTPIECVVESRKLPVFVPDL